MIAPETIQTITQRTDIIDVVGEFVKLKKRGANYLGLCPFHGEKTPSFTVSPSKEIYKCFGCGKSGNAITFLIEHEKYSYVEALKWLAERYNIEVEETEVNEETRQQMHVADSLYIINNYAGKYFTNQLWETEEGKNIALSYMKERGFNNATLEKFHVGYSPNSYDHFTKTALAAQYNAQLLLKAGLVAANQNNDSLRDNYRGRIIFPIHNLTGKIIGFGARIIGRAENAPKYINTPENEIYIKSRILYGIYFARQTIDKEDECLLVEGYTDVISLAQAGVENVVASGGTSLTQDQLRLVKKFTNNLTIIYDGDSAGIKAALRGLDLALEEGLNVRLVLIPDGEDPDSYVKKVGEIRFREFINTNKRDFILFEMDVLLAEAGDDISKKNEAVNKIAESISKINKAEDFTRQQEYIRKCATVMKIDEAGLTTLVNKYTRDKIGKLEKRDSFRKQTVETGRTDLKDDLAYFKNKDDVQEKNLLRVLIEMGPETWDKDYTVAQYIFSELDNFPIRNEQYEKILELYKSQYEQGLQPSAKTLMYTNDQELNKCIVDITMFPYEVSKRWSEMNRKIVDTQSEDDLNDVRLTLLHYKLRKIKNMIDENQSELEQLISDELIIQKLLIHQQLKNFEKEITDQIGAVIVK